MACGWVLGPDRAGGVWDTRNIARNGTTSALPRRSDDNSVRPKLRSRLDRVMVNFSKTGPPGPALSFARRGEHLFGMAIDLHTAPDSLDPAIAADQNGCANDPKERFAIHGFFAPGTIGFEHFVSLIRDERNSEHVLVSKSLLRR